MSHTPVNKGGGKWFLRVCCGYDGTHKKSISRTIQLDPSMTMKAQEREAKKQSALLEAEIANGKLVASKSVTILELSERFMRDHVERRGLSPRTRAQYQYILDRFILPNIGSVRIRDIKPTKLNDFYARLEKQKPRGHTDKEQLSGTYLQKVHGLMFTMLNDAVKWGLLASNPAERASAPRKETPTRAAYTPEQCVQLLDALDKEPPKWRALGTFALYTQMRRGEIVALNWSDIDGDTVDVQHGAIYVPHEGEMVRAPKTDKSKRMIKLSPDVQHVLREWRLEQAQDRLKLCGAWEDSGAVFTQWNGARLHVDSPTKWFNHFLKRNNLPHIRFHDLRHTGASLLISQGMDVESVRQRLGHADASTTLRIYSHAFATAEQRAADILQGVLSREKTL